MTAAAEFFRTFAAAHRLWNDDSPCRNIHGHNYRASVMIESEAPEPLNAQGFLVPFSAVKDAIDYFDHALLLDAGDPLYESFEALTRVRSCPGAPSTERFAGLLAEDIAAAVATANVRAVPFHVNVRLQETDGIVAYGTAERS